MATVTLTKWGNSVGLRIPSTILKEAHLSIGEELEIIAEENGCLILRPKKHPRKYWAAGFNKITENQVEETEIIDIPNDFDKNDWTW